MEILEILKNSKDEIYPEDLDFFETELATGEYDEAYIAACKEQIALIRNWMAEKDSPTEEIGTENSKRSKSTGKTLVMGIHDVAPESANPVAASMSPEDIIFRI